MKEEVNNHASAKAYTVDSATRGSGTLGYGIHREARIKYIRSAAQRPELEPGSTRGSFLNEQGSKCREKERNIPSLE